VKPLLHCLPDEQSVDARSHIVLSECKAERRCKDGSLHGVAFRVEGLGLFAARANSGELQHSCEQ
jgi:hypothetical protein